VTLLHDAAAERFRIAMADHMFTSTCVGPLADSGHRVTRPGRRAGCRWSRTWGLPSLPYV